MLIFSNDLNKFLQEIFSDLQCQEETKSYIISIFDKYLVSENDLSTDSVTILYARAREQHDFSIYQNCGDWLFYLNALFQEHLKFASKEYYDHIAQSSYYSCYLIINKQWDLYRELAQNYHILNEQVKNKLKYL